MTIQPTFFNWATSGLPYNQPPWEQMSPNLLELNHYLVLIYGGQPLGLDDFDREIRTGGAISSHAYGAALDWRYAPNWLPNTSPRLVGRDTAINIILPWIIHNSAELHIDAIHDYVGDRIWRAGRTSNLNDAHGSWWKKQNGAGSGMGESWAQYFHFETTFTGWADPTSILDRFYGSPTKPPIPTERRQDMLAIVSFDDETPATGWCSLNGGRTRFKFRDEQHMMSTCRAGAFDAWTWNIIETTTQTEFDEIHEQVSALSVGYLDLRMGTIE